MTILYFLILDKEILIFLAALLLLRFMLLVTPLKLVGPSGSPIRAIGVEESKIDLLQR
jgi:hypothetical protein